MPGPTSLPVGESDTPRVRQSVLTIENPFGLDWTLTTGIVSALDIQSIPRYATILPQAMLTAHLV